MSRLGPALAERGGYAERTDDGAFKVTGIGQQELGDLAHEVGARLHELRTQEATLEEAFFEATGMAAEFVAQGPGPYARPYPGPPGRPWRACRR